MEGQITKKAKVLCIASALLGLGMGMYPPFALIFGGAFAILWFIQFFAIMDTKSEAGRKQQIELVFVMGAALLCGGLFAQVVDFLRAAFQAAS